jgi:hypothetical protein
MPEKDKAPGLGDRYGCFVALAVVAVLLLMGWWKTQGG